jgi:hypothetical protein
VKPDRDSSGIEVTSTIDGQKVEMGIDQNAMAHIMSILTDLYSDPQLAVIREYATNALDAHIEAGNSMPIEVTTPTQLSPFLTIRDYGVGLDAGDIERIYSQYGASTKRDTNKQVGMLGLGCKSALTYAQQFTLVGVKDGISCQVSISRDDDGGGSMTVVDQSPTDASSGVTITIPVERYNQLERKAQDFFRFWPEGTVLLNGAEPERVDGLWITDKLLVTSDFDSDYIVMGNVPYPTTIDCGLTGYNNHVVAFVDIGAVNFTPSRESLHMTGKTEKAIATIKQEFHDHAQGAIQRRIDECSNHSEALKEMIRWEAVMPVKARSQSYTFQGDAIPEDYKADRIVMSDRRGYGRLSSHSNTTVVTVEAWARSMWVHSYEEANFTAGQKKKLNKYVDENEVEGVRTYILTKGKPDMRWIDSERVVDWATIKAIKLPRTSRGGGPGRIAGSYDIWKDGERKNEVPAGNLDSKKPMFHFTRSMGGYEARYIRLLEAKHPGCTVVYLQANRVGKFERDFPKSQAVLEAIRSDYETWRDSMDDDTKLALAIEDAYDTRDLEPIDPSRVDDPVIKEAARIAKIDLTIVEEQRRIYRELFGYRSGPELPDWTNPLDEAYPLYNEDVLEADPEHVYLYLNAVYAARTKEG